jgi:ABC-type lipoprotein export system ATPase subunit
VRTLDKRILISMNECKFKWNEDAVFDFEICKGEIVGVCGKSRYYIIHAMLGHNECMSGVMRQRGVIGYFSEDPFICNASIRENILMGGEFDGKRYYDAVALTGLNADVLHSIGMDDLPIQADDLTLQQKQRIVLARAVYNDRDLYMFVEPLQNADFSSSILQIFERVVQHIASDPNKAIIICSSNIHILNMCQKIYHSTENRMYSRDNSQEFATLNIHNEIPEHCSVQELNIRGCNRDSLTSTRPHNAGGTTGNYEDSTEELIQRNLHTDAFSIGIINLAFLSIFTLIRTGVYLLLIIGFIIVTMKNIVEPWFNLVFLGEHAHTH